MPAAALRQYHVVASYLYFLTLALYLLPALYLMLAPLFRPLPPGMGSAEIGMVVFSCALMLAFAIRIGVVIREGKRWAKGLFLLFLAYVLYRFARTVPNLSQHGAWWAIRQLLSLALQLVTAFFLFKDSYRRRPAT